MTRWLLACAVCLLVGLAVGRYTAAPPKEERREQTVENIASSEQIDETGSEAVTVEAKEEATAKVEATTERVRIVYREREEKPDGSTRERELELDAELAHLVAEARSSREEITRLEAEVARLEARELAVERREDLFLKVEAPLPTWRFGAVGGLDIPAAALVYGGSLERRIWGPVYVGATVLSNGTVLGQMSAGLW